MKTFLMRDILDSIRTQRGRMGLALAAIAIGVVALTVLQCILNGLHQKAQSLVHEFGVDVIALTASPETDLRSSYAKVLRKNLPEFHVSIIARHQVYIPEVNARHWVVATDASLFRIRKWRILQGRALDQNDIARRQHHCVITEAFSKESGLRLHNSLRLKNTLFRIVGIVARENNAINDAAFSDVASMYIPYTILPYWKNDLHPPIDEVDALLLQIPSSTTLEKTIFLLPNILAPEIKGRKDLRMTTSDTLIYGIRKLQMTLRLSAGFIAFLCLTLGGCVLMSIMIANVRERIPEIGLRLALGASEGDIYALFLGEAVLITGMAAILGSIAGHLLLLLLRQTMPIPFSFALNAWLTPFVIAMALGLFFSFFPARYAARINPADALRHE